MQAGSPALPDTPAQKSAEIVQKLLKSGAVCIGSVNMHELALGTTSENAHFGFVLNPRDHGRTAGGSSGGTAAAVADGSVPFALGTDTGGSCRIPAAYCGVVGFRPTTGRYPSDGVFMISPTRDTVGVMANNVHSVSLVDSVVTGEHDGIQLSPASLKIGLPRSGFFSQLSPEVEAAVEVAVQKLTEAGIECFDVEVAGSHDIAEAGFRVVGYEAPREVLSLWGRSAPADMFSEEDLRLLRGFVANISSPDVANTFTHFIETPVSLSDYHEALAQREVLQASYERAFTEQNISALIYPTVGIIAPLSGEDPVTVNGIEFPHFPYSIRNTDPGSLAGQPSLSIPLPRDNDELPIGLGIEGKRYEDRYLLSVAAVIEKILTHP
jgi:mandelamide amidase